MENPPLKHLREQMEKSLYLQQQALIKVKESKNPVTRVFLQKEADQHKTRAEYYVRRMIDHGATSVIIKVSGEIWVEEPGKGRSKIRTIKRFQMLLSCPTLEDAQETFEAQVLNTMEFIPESVTYKTIPLKHILLISK